jgi:hypothetical protein
MPIANRWQGAVNATAQQNQTQQPRVEHPSAEQLLEA